MPLRSWFCFKNLENLFDQGTFIYIYLTVRDIYLRWRVIFWWRGTFFWWRGTFIWQEGTFILWRVTILLQIVRGTKFLSWVRTHRARTHGQKGTQICEPLANKCPQSHLISFYLKNSNIYLTRGHFLRRVTILLQIIRGTKLWSCVRTLNDIKNSISFGSKYL